MPPQLPEIARAELLRRLAEGRDAALSVVTPNTRMAQSLQRDFDADRLRAGLSTWETPDILPFGAFVARLWEDALYSPRGASVPLLLTPVQEQAAWDEVVRSAHTAAPVFSAPAAAVQCRDAWQLAHAWRIDARRAGSPNEDVAAWLDWSARYERLTRDRGQTDGARLPDVVAKWLDLGSRKPLAVAIAGFDIVNPQMREFLEVLAACGCSLFQVAARARPGKVSRVELTQYKDEITAAASWAHARLAAGGEKPPRIGVVVPDLARSRERVRRTFAAAMNPGHVLGLASPLPFNISLGAPLSEFPLVGDALLVLALAGPEISFDQASRLVRSPFIGGAEAEKEVRARLDAHMRERSAPAIKLDQVLKLAAAARGAKAPLLLDRLAVLRDLRKASLFGARGAADWAKAFSEALKAIGFPGERPLDSAEHQALERWHSLLTEFGSLERVTAKMGYADACQRLARMAREAIFQPEAPDVPVQVLGVLESAGLEFDHLWVMGLTDEAWPLPARANPFLPVRAQRAAGIPQADPGSSLELDRRITAGWKNAAAEVVFSHSRVRDESALAPSPLIASIAATTLELLGVTRLPTLRDAIRSAARIEFLDDARAPAITSPTQRGGTGLFRDQAACPFRGFAHRRVGAKPLETPRFGLDPRDRGNLLHEMLAEVWRGLDTQAVLLRAAPAQLDELLDRSARSAIERVKKKRGDALSGRFERMEHARLMRLAREWLAVERTREDFAVAAIEDKRPMTFGGVTIEARLDRMDVLRKGRAVIDYKTGVCSTGTWLGARPDEPQLPMYVLASDADVTAIAFGQVKTGEMRFWGIAREEDAIPKLKTADKDPSRVAKYRDWDHLVAHWREEIERIGSGFAAGDARVDPKKGPLTCEMCDQHAFCRIAEKGSFGVKKGESEDE
ncbi:MAG: PD-(D/E)XK nuclease family protein [Usitatibacter sp.]